METLAEGFALVEAPRAGDAGAIFFSDVLSGGVYRRWPDGRVDVVVPKRRGVGGILRHADGGLLVSGRDLSHERDGESRVAAQPPEGAAGFNDMTADERGNVYVGVVRWQVFGGDEAVAGEVLRIEPGGGTSVVGEGLLLPNGMGLSPDGLTLYACDFVRGLVLAFDPEGADPGGRIHATSPSGDADGLAVDEAGAVWVALGGGSGVARFLPDGSLDRMLEVPGAFVASVSFAGDDRRDLLIATAADPRDPDSSGALLRTRVDVPGLPVPAARI